MKNVLLLLCFVSSIAAAQTPRYWIASGPGVWSDQNNWATMSNGSGPASPPNSTSYSAYFDGAGGKNGNCTLDIAPTIAGISISGYTGTITLANDLTSTGTNVVTTGLLTGANKFILNTTNTNTTFGNSITPNGVTIDVEISYTGLGSGTVLFNGAIFNQKVSIKKTSTTADNGWGGNTFKEIVTFENNATGGSFGLASTNPNSFEKDLTIISSASGSSTNIANNTAGTQFKGNVSVNYNYSGAGVPGPITFGNNGGTSSFVGTGIMTLTCTGTQGCGDLTIAGLTYSGGLTHTFDLTQNGSTTASLILGPSSSSFTNRSSFNGSLNAKAPRLFINGIICLDASKSISLEKTAGTTDTGFGNSSFDGSVTIVNSSSTNLETNGGNTFNGSISVQNTGAGNISLERVSGSTYSGASTFSNSGTGSSSIRVGYAGTTSLGGNVTVNSTGTGGTYGVYFGDEIGLGSVSLADSKTIKEGTFNTGELRLINFSQNDANTAQTIMLTSTASTASGLRIGPNSTFKGDVTFSAPSVWLDGCTYGVSSSTTTSIITKTGASTPDASRGGNVFNTNFILKNTGSGVFAMAATSGGTADIFNGKLTVNSTSTGAIRLSDKVNGTQFNGDLVLNSDGTGGITTGSNGGTSILKEGKTLNNSASTNGTVQLAFFTQGTTTRGTTQTVTFPWTGTETTTLTLGPSSTFYGDVVLSSPGIRLNGATYKGTATFTKTGSSTDPGDGGNTFEDVASLSNSGTGEFRTANSTKDTFMGNVTLTNSNTGNVSLAYNNGTATDFQKNVIFNSSCTTCSTMNGVYIGSAGGGGVGATLAIGSKLQTGTVSGGKIFLGKLKQPSGVTDMQTLSFSHNTDNPILHVSNSYFRGDATFTADRILLDGNTFEGTNTFTFAGTTDAYSTGGNNFTGGAAGTNVTTLATSSSATANWAFSFPGAGDTFSGPLIINKGGTGNINLAHNVTSGTTTFNNSVSFNSSATSGFITVGIAGGNGATVNGTNTLCMNCGPSGGVAVANGATVTLGKVDVMNDQTIFSNSTNSPTTFTGQLNIGYTSTSLACHFRGNLTVKQNRVTIQYSTFDGDTSIEKTGGNTDTSSGSNTFGNASTDAIQINNSGTGTFTLGGDTFNGVTTGTNSSTGTLSLPGTDTFNASATFTNSSTGTLSLAGTDAYNSGASFNNTGTGSLLPANTGTSSFYGDISTNASSAIIFGNGGGNVTFAGGSNQNIGKTMSTTSPKFTAINLSKTAGSITLNTDISISTTASVTSPFVYFTKASVGGIITSTSTNIINFDDNAVVQGTVSNTSHINGPVQKKGNDNFTFPTGNNGKYRSIAIDNSSGGTSDVFFAQYSQSSPIPSTGTAKASTLTQFSGCEYWWLNQVTGTSSVPVTLSWYAPDCPVYNITSLANLSVSRWDGTMWTDLGSPNGGTTGTTGPTSQGTVKTQSAISSFGYFTLATASNLNSLPVELVSFNVYAIQNHSAHLEWRTASELNNYGFEIYKSIDGKEFYKIGFVEGNGTTNQLHDYTFSDLNLVSKSYYKIRQLDYDGHSAYSEVRLLTIEGDLVKRLVVYPNPVDKSAQIALTGINDEEFVEIKILDGGGQIIRSYKGTVSEIREFLNDDIVNLASGLYIMRAAMLSGNLHCKFIKL